jgi:glycosyltransferase involved in cell wall biosynthesis
MRIAIDIREVGAKRAGKGYTIFELVNHLAKIDQENNYLLYSQKSLSWNLPARFKLKIVDGRSLIWHRNLAREMVRDNVDVFLAGLSYINAILSRVPTVVIVHDLAVFNSPVKSKRKSVIVEKLTLKRACQKAKEILVVSEATKKALLNFDGSFKEKITVAPNAASDRFRPHESKEVKPLLDKLQIGEGYILFLSTIEPRKNITTLIEAYSKLPSEISNERPLVIAGKKGWYYEEVFNLVQKLNLSKKVKFIGYVQDEDVPLLYAGAGVFVFPSVYEGFGLPVVEALKSGVPTVISDAEALVEVGGDAVLVAKTYDSADFAKKIEQILVDKSLAKHQVAKGLEYVKKYNWTDTAKTVLSALEKAAAE